MIGYTVEHREDKLTLRRTNTWLGSLIVSLPLFVGVVWAGQSVFNQPINMIMMAAFLLVIRGMLTVLYRLLVWGRYIVFDKNNNMLIIDGRDICALSDVISVRLEGSAQSQLLPKMGRLVSLHLRTAQGRDLELDQEWEGNLNYATLKAATQEIAEFVNGGKSQIA